MVLPFVRRISRLRNFPRTLSAAFGGACLYTLKTEIEPEGKEGDKGERERRMKREG